MEHHVYFWLREERQDEESRSIFEAGLDALCQSVHINRYNWAKPAATAKRPVTDHSWSYAISLEFKTMADHDAYQDGDPVHDQFIADFKEWWAKVQVMDLA